MRHFANLLQIFLISNGVLSLLAGVFFGVLPGSVLETAHAFFGSTTVLLAVAFLPCMAINRNLPKRVFLPQIFLLIWDFTGLWPLSGVFGVLQAHLLASMMQVLLGVMALLHNRMRNGTSPYLTREMFTDPGFRVGHFLRFGAASLLVLPICLLFFGFSLTTSYLDRLSGGFVRLGLDGLYMTERTYSQKEKKVRLTSMIHIGDQDYYDDLSRSITTARTIVLSEGVSDRDGLLQEKFSYGGVADFLGLSAQEKMELDGRLIDIEQLAREDFSGAQTGQTDIARADIDLREFDPQTLAFINALGAHLLNNSSLADGFKAFNLWAAENVTPETNDIIMADLIDKRNRVLLGHLASALKKYDTIVVPWGALHLPGIEKNVIAQGFVLQQSKERRSIDFRNIPYAELIEKFSAETD